MHPNTLLSAVALFATASEAALHRGHRGGRVRGRHMHHAMRPHLVQNQQGAPTGSDSIGLVSGPDTTSTTSAVSPAGTASDLLSAPALNNNTTAPMPMNTGSSTSRSFGSSGLLVLFPNSTASVASSPEAITGSSSSLPASSGPSCLFSVVTLTETVDITVSVTATTASQLVTYDVWHNTSSVAPLPTKKLDVSLGSSLAPVIAAASSSSSEPHNYASSSSLPPRNSTVSKPTPMSYISAAEASSIRLSTAAGSMVAPEFNISATATPRRMVFLNTTTTSRLASIPAATQGSTEAALRVSNNTVLVVIANSTQPPRHFVQAPAVTATAIQTFWTTRVIDPSITPIATASLTSIFTTAASPTQTVCATDAPSGPPRAGNAHCGVHGVPVGDYFIGEFVQNKDDVPVTLEGCFQFCSSVWGITHGCQSYDYFINDLGAPRCKLYGSPVAFALDSIDNYQPHTWFDLECGDPTSPKWADVGSSSHLNASAGFAP